MTDGHGIATIMIFVESSEKSIIAARYAVWLAKTMGARIIALYVVDTQALEELLRARIFVRMERVDYERDIEEDAKRYLNMVKDLAEAKGVELTTVLDKGAVHSIVARKVSELGVDLLVMGEHAAPRSRRECYYDEGQRVLCEARCPVLVVKGDERIRSLYNGIS